MIDYYAMIDATGPRPPRPGDTAVFGFRGQAFVTRAYVVGVSGIAVSTALSASAAIASIDSAITIVNQTRADMGAVQNRLEQTISRLNLVAENLQAAESRIRDADMAEEMIKLTKSQILQQSGTAMLAQANQAPQSVLQLLQ